MSQITKLPIPRPLYPCSQCSEDYSWPAEDLFWSPVTKQWICRECWDDEAHGDTKGPSLAETIKAQNTSHVQTLRKIKLICLTTTKEQMGLAHIVRLCIDAGITEHLDELEATLTPGVPDTPKPPAD